MRWNSPFCHEVVFLRASAPPRIRVNGCLQAKRSKADGIGFGTFWQRNARGVVPRRGWVVGLGRMGHGNGRRKLLTSCSQDCKKLARRLFSITTYNVCHMELLSGVRPPRPPGRAPRLYAHSSQPFPPHARPDHTPRLPARARAPAFTPTGLDPVRDNRTGGFSAGAAMRDCPPFGAPRALSRVREARGGEIQKHPPKQRRSVRAFSFKLLSRAPRLTARDRPPVARIGTCSGAVRARMCRLFPSAVSCLRAPRCLHLSFYGMRQFLE